MAVHHPDGVESLHHARDGRRTYARVRTYAVNVERAFWARANCIELASMFDASPELLEAARPFLPHFRFVLDDLSALSAATLASRPLAPLPRLVQLALWASRSFSRLEDAAPFMRAVVATLVRDERTRALLGQFNLYLFSTAPADVDKATSVVSFSR